MNNQTNATDNSTIPIVYALGPPLATISSICIFIGTIFSILSIIQYLRESQLRNHFTYLFHGILFFCLLSSFINVPIFLIGYYLKIFENFPSLCRFYIINALSIYIGVLTCLAYASVERNYFIFRRNSPLTCRRQIIPMICLTIYSYVLSIFLTFIDQCEYIPCQSCFSRQVNFQILWIVISFLLPEFVMFTSTFVLIVRLYRQRNRFHRQKDRRIFSRIVIQMLFYVVWSCCYFCPPSFYSFSLLLNSSRSSPTTKSTMIIVSTVSVQTYPLLTFILMFHFPRRIRSKNTKSNEEIFHPNESIWRINIPSKLSDPVINPSR